MARDDHPKAPRGDASEHSVGGCGIAPEAAAASAQSARPKPPLRTTPSDSRLMLQPGQIKSDASAESARASPSPLGASGPPLGASGPPLGASGPPLGASGPPLGAWALAIIFVLASYPPITMEIYIPSLPSLQVSLHTSPAAVLLTLSVYSAAFSLLQVGLGPASDVCGRRSLLLFGLATYSAAAYACAAAEGVGLMLPARALQAFGSASATIISQAMLRDLYKVSEREVLMSRLALVRSSWVVLSPVLGSAFGALLGWRASFLFLALLGHVSLAGAYLLLPESLPRERRQLRCGVGDLFRANATLLTSREFMCYALPEAIGFGALFVWISTSSFILQNFYKLPLSLFGACYTLSFLGAIGGSYASPRIRRRFDLQPRDLFLGASLLGAVAAITLLGFSGSPLALRPSLLSQFCLQSCLLVYVFTIAVTGVQAQVEALEPFPALAATAAGLMGAKRSGITCLVAICSGSLLGAEGDDPRVVYCAIAALGIAKPILHWVIRPRAGGSNLEPACESKTEKTEPMEVRVQVK